MRRVRLLNALRNMLIVDPGTVLSARRSFAEELCRENHISSMALCAAFASVPRERFAGPGPWIVQSNGASWSTQDSDPSRLYRDVLIVLDPARHLNNGQPSLWAIHLDLLRVRPGDQILHLGCGTGYYTAILAELTGPAGKVTAVEIEEGLAKRARTALDPWPWVRVMHADGARGPFDPADVIVVSAGATHPLPAWLTALKSDGRLLFPLTPMRGPGAMAYLTRTAPSQFLATLHGSVLFVGFEGARNPATSHELARALKQDEGAGVHSLRCDLHKKDESCWLHGEGWCFSRRSPFVPAPT